MSAKVIGLVFVILLSSTIAGRQNSQAEIDLEGAKRTQNLKGDPGAAIKEFETVLSRYGKDPVIAVQALLHIAECYRDLRNPEAQKEAYDRILKEFPGQTAAVKEAHAGLALLRPTPATNASQKMQESTVALSVYGPVSPDGKYAFNLENGRARLVDLGSGAALTFPDGTDNQIGWAEEISFSRDGKQIAYNYYVRTEDRYELRTADFQRSQISAPTKILVRDVGWIRPYDWTPDKQWVAVEIGDDKRIEIGLVSIVDGTRRGMKDVPRSPRNMSISPDGKYLAYDNPATGHVRQRDIFVQAIDEDGRNEAVLTDATNDVLVGWSPDGRHLIYASEQASGQVNLLGLPISSGKSQGTPIPMRPDIGLGETMGLTASGSFHWLYRPTFGLLTSAVRIQPMSLGMVRPSGDPNSAVIDAAASTDPDWSHDGKYLVAVTQTQGLNRGDRRLTVRSSDGKVVREVQPDLVSFFEVRWASDDRSFIGRGMDAAGREGIYRIDSGSGTVSPLVTDDCNSCGSPVSSPDGKRIYYIRTRTGSKDLPRLQTLLVRDLSSGKDSVLFERQQTPPFTFALSPDGQRIAIREWSSLISLIPASGGTPQAFARGQLMGWSPDSRSVMVSSGTDLSYVSLDGKVTKVNIDVDVSALRGPLAVHPEGKLVAWTVIPPAVTQRGSTIRVFENVVATLSAPPQAPIGARGTRSPAMYQLTWFDRSGNEMGKVGPPAPYVGSGIGSVSPDGKSLAISIAPEGDIWIIDLINGSQRRLTFNGEGAPQPSSMGWSPDGSQMAYSSRRNGKWGLYLRRTDGNGAEEFLLETSGAIGSGMNWSPDGKFIVYGVTDPKTAGDVWALRMTGDRKPIPIVQTMADENGPQVSPDGKWIAYRSDQTGRREVYIRSFPDGAAELQVSKEGGYAPKWRSDSRELFFIKVGFARVFASDLQINGSSIEAGVPKDLASTFSSDYGVTPDGQRILIPVPVSATPATR